MMKEKEIDSLIRDALSEKETEQFDAMNIEPSIFQLAMKTFQGRNRWVTAIAVFASLLFIGTGAYSGRVFFETPPGDVKTLIVWAAAFFFSLIAVSMMKIWSWMEIEKYSTVREIKRLELQVALLSQSIRQNQETTNASK